MKRKREKMLFTWVEVGCRNKKPKQGDPDIEPDFNSNRPQIELLLKNVPNYKDYFPLPYEMLMKIFKYVIELSDHPIADLCNIARVCESWRQLVLSSPALWYRIDLSQLPITDKNLLTLSRIFKLNSAIIEYVKEVAFSGAIDCKSTKSSAFIETLITAPNISSLSLRDLRPKNRVSLPTLVYRSINRCKNLRSLSITHSKLLFNNQKWLSDHLLESGAQLEVLDLAMSLTSISSQLFRAISSDYCPNLRVLDISTCDALNTHSFDAIQLSQNVKNLEVLRVGNVSFKRVYNTPERFGLNKLKELSMPIGMRDADRDDALFATLTFGSDQVKVLDLRGSTISTSALIEMPSYTVKELHMDDLCPLNRKQYHRVIKKWSNTLEILSLVKINCSETMKSCLDALCSDGRTNSNIRVLDLSSSDVTVEDLKRFLKVAKSLVSIDLTSCRSLPRGCKGQYSNRPIDLKTKELRLLQRSLKVA